MADPSNPADVPEAASPGDGQPEHPTPAGPGSGGEMGGDPPGAAPGEPTATLPATPPRWAGRAGVPQPSGTGFDQDDWVGPPPRAGWLMPTLLVLVGLALAGLIVLGLWLAVHGQTPAPAASTTPTPTSASSPSVVPTTASAAPSSAGPSPSSSVGTVVVPVVKGRSPADAVTALHQAGFTSVTTQVATPDTPGYADVPDGTAVGTNPAAGSSVDPTAPIVVLVKPEASASPSPSSS